MTDIPAQELPEFLKRFDLLPNECKGLSFEIAFRNGSLAPNERESPLWYRQCATASHAIREATPGSTLESTVSLLGMKDETHSVFAVGEIAKAVLDAPRGGTIRARVMTVYETVPNEASQSCHPADRRYEEIKGLLIEEILSIEDPPDA